MNTELNPSIKVLENVVKDTIKDLEGKPTTREDREKLLELTSKLTDLIRILIFQS